MDIKIKRLLRDLANPDDDLRALSTMTLMKLDFPDKAVREVVVKELMTATQDKNISVRFFARKAIDKIKRTENLLKAGGPAAKAPIEVRLKSDSYEERLEAVMQVNEEKNAAYKDHLIAMLSVEQHAFVKAALISCLKHFLDKTQAGYLSPFLSDPDNRVRSNCIEALEYMKVQEAIPSLFSALSDPDNRIRSVAAKALQSFGEEKVFTELKKMLESDEEWMKGSAIYALSHIQAGESISMLIEAARSAEHGETRLKAIIALANYNDLSSYGFLKHLAITGEPPFKEAAARSLKLIEEKFGPEPPTSTLVVAPEEKEENIENSSASAESSKPADLASTVSKFFRKGKDEAIGLSKKAAINFAVTDLEKEIGELQKEVGKIVFEIYQSGELALPELLTIGHEILRMNYFIQKYQEQETKKESPKETGFFGQLKSLFSKANEKVTKSSEADKFIKKRDELFVRLGQLSFRKYELEEFKHDAIEGYCLTYKSLIKKLENEKKKLEY